MPGNPRTPQLPGLALATLVSLSRGSTAAEVLAALLEHGPLPSAYSSVRGVPVDPEFRVKRALDRCRRDGLVVMPRDGHYWPLALGPASEGRDRLAEWDYCTRCRLPKRPEEMSPAGRCRCRPCRREDTREYNARPDVAERERERLRQYREDHRDMLLERYRQHYLDNAEYRKARIRQWQKNNPEKCTAYHRETRHRRAAAGPLSAAERIDTRMRQGIWEALRGLKAGRRWETLVGYTLGDLIARLEGTFSEGMNWENYGKGPGRWSIDHIVPRAAFSYETAEDPAFLECWELANLSAAWFSDNASKGSVHAGFRHYNWRDPVPLGKP
ncbi:MAG: hypothetical protein Q7U75_11825 [Desulfobacterales bacterium]|nr:hypothetical protein [Desulfobacterales bacterium]